MTQEEAQAESVRRWGTNGIAMIDFDGEFIVGAAEIEDGRFLAPGMQGYSYTSFENAFEDAEDRA